jgi:hypothetical protein
MTISERRATTVFDRSNLTILGILNISDPIPTNYTTNDFFAFYDILFTVNETEPFYNVTAQFSLITTVMSLINGNGDTFFDIGDDSGVSSLQQLLASIPLIFNALYWQLALPSDLNMGKSIALAIPRYRVATPSAISLTSS